MANNNAILRGGAAAEMSLDELFGAVEQEWQDQALCAQTDPEAFFLKREALPVRPSASARPARCAMNAWSMRWSTMSASVFGAGYRTVSVVASNVRLDN